MSPLRVVKESADTLIDVGASDFRSQLYKLKKETEVSAWQAMEQHLITSLKQQQSQQQSETSITQGAAQ